MGSVPSNVSDYNIVIHTNMMLVGEHAGRYIAPIASEVALVIVGQQFGKRDTILRIRDENLQKINLFHSVYVIRLQYSLMCFLGEDG